MAGSKRAGKGKGENGDRKEATRKGSGRGRERKGVLQVQIHCKKITQEFIIISLTTFSIKSAIFWFKCKYDDDTIKQQVL